MNKKIDQDLKRFRKQIDQADMALLKALSARFKAVEKVGALKRKRNLPVVQKARWKELLADRLKRAKKLKVSDQLIKTVFQAIHQEAILIQKRRK